MSNKKKFLRFAEIAYLLVAAVFIVETIISLRNNDPSWWLTLIFSVAAIGMYFFKKHFRKKMDKDKKN